MDSEKNTREQSVGFYLCERGTAGVAIKELVLQAKQLRTLLYRPGLSMDDYRGPVL